MQEERIYRFNFFSSHHQFYIGDKDADGDTGDEDFWSDEAVESRLALSTGIVGVGIESYSGAKGEITLLKVANTSFDVNAYDRIVEGPLFLISGILRVVNCPNSDVEMELKVEPGNYAVRIYSSNFDSIVDEEGDDYYRVEIWPVAEVIVRRVLKTYNDPKLS